MGSDSAGVAEEAETSVSEFAAVGDDGLSSVPDDVSKSARFSSLSSRMVLCNCESWVEWYT